MLVTFASTYKWWLSVQPTLQYSKYNTVQTYLILIHYAEIINFVSIQFLHYQTYVFKILVQEENAMPVR